MGKPVVKKKAAVAATKKAATKVKPSAAAKKRPAASAAAPRARGGASARTTTKKSKAAAAPAHGEELSLARFVSDELEVPGIPGELVHVAEARGVHGAAPKGKYVYCIIRSQAQLRFGALGIGTEPSTVYTIGYRDLAAVVSDTPMGVHDPTRENVLAHNRVTETVMREHTVIPMAFGTTFRTRDDIIELLRSAYDAFGDVLTKMQSKLEFGLKVLWDRDAIVKEIEADDEDVRRLKSEIQSQKGSTYFARMQYGRLIDAALQLRSERYVSDIFAALRDVSVASRSNKPIGDKMIMNAAFLVMREKETAFDTKVKGIAEKYDKCTFKYTGPWPPYNFVNIRLKLERAK